MCQQISRPRASLAIMSLTGHCVLLVFGGLACNILAAESILWTQELTLCLPDRPRSMFTLLGGLLGEVEASDGESPQEQTQKSGTPGVGLGTIRLHLTFLRKSLMLIMGSSKYLYLLCSSACPPGHVHGHPKPLLCEAI